MSGVGSAKCGAQQLVVNQVAEILERYPVDGIHFDDYFFVDGMQDTLPQEEKCRR